MATYLAHHGIKGQKWGIRRYQNPDGTYTPEGYARYRSDRQFNGTYNHKLYSKEDRMTAYKLRSKKVSDDEKINIIKSDSRTKNGINTISRLQKEHGELVNGMIDARSKYLRDMYKSPQKIKDVLDNEIFLRTSNKKEAEAFVSGLTKEKVLELLNSNYSGDFEKYTKARKIDSEIQFEVQRLVDDLLMSYGGINYANSIKDLSTFSGVKSARELVKSTLLEKVTKNNTDYYSVETKEANKSIGNLYNSYNVSDYINSFDFSELLSKEY